MLRIHTLLLLCTLAFSLPSAKAQESSDVAPATISRVCLWNADQDTWKELGLKRSQISRMNELRQQFPAVVDGQWVANEDMDGEPEPVLNDHTVVDPRLSTSLKVPAASTAPPVKKSRIKDPGTAVRSTGLQHQLREVLTPAQLKQWAKACEY